MFIKSEAYYDAIYNAVGKDYAHEVQLLHGLIQKHKTSPGSHLLDVACGTGSHIEHLQTLYQVEGLDLDEGMLAIARHRFPNIPFRHCDMLDFRLGTRYDVITCLFGSVAYVKTVNRLNQAVANMHRHLKPGGVLLVEPFLHPDSYISDKPHGLFVDQPDLKLCRMNISRREGNLSLLDFHYLLATSDGIEHFTEHHELGLFTDAQYQEAFSACGLEPVHDPEGLDGRGLYLGVRTQPA
jgi:SAM-dependent methyltransferase